MSLLLAISFYSFGQVADSLHKQQSKHIKVQHAEPLYIDLIRDLGAHKGEREWNVDFGMVDNLRYDKYIALVEYEWAPVNRLGLEVELPLTIYTATTNGATAEKPSNRLESVKTAAEWTFLVSQKHQASFALGYLNELELTYLNTINRSEAFNGNLFNPFLVAAKRWGDFRLPVSKDRERLSSFLRLIYEPRHRQ